jgi:hypothetical protein
VDRALGLRAAASEVYWAVVEGTNSTPILVAHEKIAAPVDLDEAPALSWYHERVRHVIEAYRPGKAGVRAAEPVARGSNKEGAKRRLRIEGVLLQAIDSCGLKVTTGALATISAKLGTRNVKKYIDAGKLRGLDLAKVPPLTREAVLVAVAALPKNPR